MVEGEGFQAVAGFGYAPFLMLLCWGGLVSGLIGLCSAVVRGFRSSGPMSGVFGCSKKVLIPPILWASVYYFSFQKWARPFPSTGKLSLVIN